MKLRDWFLLISTAIVGVLVGMHVYYTTFVPEYIENSDIEVLSHGGPDAVSVTAMQYGGCSRGGSCASYELLGNRQYRYSDGHSATLEEGRVPSNLYDNIEHLVQSSNLTQLSRSAEKSCASYVDGVDYSYTITRGDAVYELDTCHTTFEGGSELGRSLSSLFAYMDNPGAYIDNASVDGLGEWVMKIIKDRINPAR